MNYTPEEVAKLLANRPNQPHYIASLIAECVAAERERCARAVGLLYWMPRVQGRWDETDVAYGHGFNKAKAEALAEIEGPNG